MNKWYWVFFGFAVILIALNAILEIEVEDSLIRGFALILGAIPLAWLFAGSFADTEQEQTIPVHKENKDLPVGFGRALLDEMPTALLIVNRQGIITYANRVATSVMPRLKVGVPFSTIFRVPQFLDTLERVWVEGTPQATSFNIMGRKQYFEARASLLPKGTDLGEDRQVLIQVQDRTSERLSEEARADFIANASHELKTPLASILGYVETLQGHAKDDPDARERFLQSVEKQAKRMQRLVEDLLSLNKIELDEHMHPESKIEYLDVVHETIEAFGLVAEKQGVVIKNTVSKRSLLVEADRDQIAQVYSNLIENALKYGGNDTEIEIGEAEPSARYPNMIGIYVADHGEGIDKKHLNRLTERFYRVNTIQSKEKGGTGLGLAIVKHILQRHRAKLQIESQLGKGSQFTVWMPIA